MSSSEGSRDLELAPMRVSTVASDDFEIVVDDSAFFQRAPEAPKKRGASAYAIQPLTGATLIPGGVVAVTGDIEGKRLDEVLQLATKIPTPTCCHIEGAGQVTEFFIKKRRITQVRSWHRTETYPPMLDVETNDERLRTRVTIALARALRWRWVFFTIMSHLNVPEIEEAPVSMSVQEALFSAFAVTA